jgi:hypothetical protein
LGKTFEPTQPLAKFFRYCNIFFDDVIDALNVDSKIAQGFFEKCLIDIKSSIPPDSEEDRAAIKMILDLLPSLDQAPETLNFIEYQKQFWANLASLHVDSLLEFIPDKIRNLPLTETGQRLTGLVDAIKLSKSGQKLPADNTFSDILVYNSKSYNFLILRFLYDRSQFYGPSILTEDFGAFAKNVFDGPKT